MYPGWTSVFCPNDRSEMIDFNKDWMQNIFNEFPIKLRSEFNVPLYVN